MGKGKKKNQQVGAAEPKDDQNAGAGPSSDAFAGALEAQRPAKGEWKKNLPKKKGAAAPKTGEEIEKDCTVSVSEPKGQSSNLGAHPKEPQVALEPPMEVPRPAKGAWKKDLPKKKDAVAPQKGQATEKDCTTPVSEPKGQSSNLGARPKERPTITTPMSKLSMEEANFPKRESITNIFTKTEEISTNYLNMDLTKLPDTIYHYDITFTPDRPKKFIQPAFNQLINDTEQLKVLVNKVAFDGVKSFYCLTKIKDADFPKISVPSPDDTGKPRDIQISIKFATEVDMKVIKYYPTYVSPNGTTIQKAVQTLDIVMKTAFNRPDVIRYKDSVFLKNGPREKMVANYELLIGLFQSFVMGAHPLLNVDVSHKAFPSGADNLEPLFANCKDRYRPDDINKQISNFKAILDGLGLVYTSPMTKDGIRKTFKFVAIKGPSSKQTFLDENKKRWTVEAYFKSKGVALKYPENPCIHVGPWDKEIFIPMEFLSIPPLQALNRQAPESCKPEMVKFAAGSTIQRKNKIMNLVKEINYSAVPSINNFGITIGKDFIKIKAHIIDPPKLQYLGRTLEITKPGEWRADKEKFLRPSTTPTNWGILVMDKKPKRNHVTMFGEAIARMAKQLGVKLSVHYNVHYFKERKDNLDKIFADFKRDNIHFLFVVISINGEQYADVKTAAETRCNILTQCIKTKNLVRCNRDGNENVDLSTLYNIMLKVNEKLDGVNHEIAENDKILLKNRRCMVIGADVTHASPGQREIPSVVGVAASYDLNAIRYKCTYRMQRNKKNNKAIQEIIENFDEMVLEHLRYFHLKNKEQWPEHILYYRDGVSDGQFPQVKEIEVAAIKKACVIIGQPDIKVTVIIVQKRHHTRFFPDPKKHGNDRNANVTPGTVVDSVIVDPEKWQFFMVAHISMQGVAKPTKYCVIHDDAGLSNQDLQVFTYHLCHLFGRCNRAVSYVAPTYYAHLVAARGRVYIQKEDINMDQLEKINAARFANNAIAEERPMFFI